MALWRLSPELDPSVISCIAKMCHGTAIDAKHFYHAVYVSSRNTLPFFKSGWKFNALAFIIGTDRRFSGITR